jgi:uncharacterized protein (DUF488 family)
MTTFTIGFTKKTAREFFTKLRDAGVRRLVDVRLNNTSQLSGFAKRDDLKFFLEELGGIEYLHLPILAPTQDILDDFKKHRGSWEEYEVAFRQLMSDRRIENNIDRTTLDAGCLLCSEHTPHHCHRRLVAEYLHEKWGDLDVQHLV